jgi:hypothetical protein
MRTIKFRGICNVKNNPHLFGTWIYGGIKFKKIKGVRMFFICDENSGGDYSVYPETVGQFTGLQDKNGVDIYEGDVIDAEKLLLVGWSNYYASVVLTAKNWAFPHYFGESCNPDEIEVIGNIHENPELLTK